MNFYELLLNRGRPSGEGMTHFEQLFAAKLAGEGGKIKELEGVPPLLFKANGTPLLDYLISGNTVQSGTPTPENPIQPQETGERTGNLFDKSSDVVGFYISSTAGVWTQTGSTSRSILIKCEPNTTYTISVPTNRTLRAVYFNNFPSAGDAGYGYKDNTTDGYVNKTMTITTGASAQYLAFFCYNSTQEATKYDEVEYFSQIMLNTGLTALPYEPYGIKIPILSNSTTTPVYLGEVETERKIGKYIFTGDENISKSSSYSDTFSISYAALGIAVGDKAVGLSTHYTIVTQAAELATGKYLLGGNYIYMCDSNAATKDDFKSYLAAQYAAGTPVTVWYVLATGETGIVNEPLHKIGDYADTVSYEQVGVEIPTVKGSNTIDVDTTLKPSEIYIKYKG